MRPLDRKKDAKLWNQAQQVLRQSRLYFEPNLGQAGPGVSAVSRGAGFLTLVSPHEAVFVNKQTHAPIRMKLLGATAAPSHDSAQPVFEEPLPGRSNYFLGNDPSRWRRDVPHYGRMRLPNVYDGIDVAYYSSEGRLEYDFLLAPNADPSRIRIAWDGVEKTTIDSSGDLILTTSAGDIRHKRPTIYQTVNGRRRPVSGHYTALGNNTFGFAVGAYDRNLALTIDPFILYSTFIGGTLADDIGAIAVDNDNNVYIGGSTRSTNFPTKTPLQANIAFGLDAFITKLAFTGGILFYSTFLGGDREDLVTAVAFDPDGNAYIAGDTYSSDFPTTERAFQRFTRLGPCDGFAAKLNAVGSTLTYSTILGEFESDDHALAIAINSSRHAIITGVVQSAIFPTTTGAYDTSHNGGLDVFVLALDTTGESLVFSTFVGGHQTDYPYAMAIDSAGNIFVAGLTTSPNFPTTTGAIRSTIGGSQDGFVFKLNHNGTRLGFSTYIGGDFPDGLYGVSLDRNGRILVAGQTISTNLPTTTGAYQSTNRGIADAFLMRLNTHGTHIIASTYLGSPHFDFGQSARALPGDWVAISGYSASSNFPTTPDAFGVSGNFNGDGFLTIFTPLLNSISYSTIVGSFGEDTAKSVQVTSQGEILLAGYTASSDFPSTSDAFDNSHNGGYDGFVMKLGGFSTSDCVAPITPAGTAYPAIGGGGGIGVTQFCNWYAFASTPWITLSSNPLTIGPGSLNYTVAQNTTADPRTGLIQVAGNQVHIIQKGSSEAAPFTDVPNSNAFVDYIRILKNGNVTNGCGNNNYCPNDFTTRGQMAAFIIRSLLGTDNFLFPTTPYFRDVPSTHPFFKWIQKLRELNITNGCNLIDYCPEDRVTRGQMAAFLIRAKFGANFTFQSTPYFSDVPANHLFFSHVQKLRQAGVTLGCGNNQYCVDNNTTRAEMAAFLTRMFLTPW